MQTEDGNATAVRGFERDGEGSGGGILINMSVWESVETLAAYAYGDAHLAVLRRRREWFERMTHAYATTAPRPTPSRSRSTSRRRAAPTPPRSRAPRTGPAPSSATPRKVNLT